MDILILIMSKTETFVAKIQASRNGRIQVPTNVVALMKLKGGTRLRVTIVRL